MGFYLAQKVTMKTSFIDQNAQLVQLCQELSNGDFVAVDTEFVREQTYYPQIALIQIGNHETLACIDPLAVDDLSPLKALFANPNITKVFHASGQDLEIFYQLFGELPLPLFDTQIAATVLGQGEQIGYANLVNEILGIELDKSHSRTNWLQRPLDAKQISYAEDDVRYLAQIYPKLLDSLESQGRLEWLNSDFELLADPSRYQPDPADAWKKVKGVNRLRGLQLAILQQVAAWREEFAIERNKPKRWIVGDQILLDIAKLKPKTIAALEKIRGIPAALVQRNGEILIAAVKHAEAMDKESWPSMKRRKRLSGAQDACVDALTAILKLKAAEFQITPSTLASHKELELLVGGERDLPILHGWRYQHGGQALLAFLEGKTQLYLEQGKLKLELLA